MCGIATFKLNVNLRGNHNKYTLKQLRLAKFEVAMFALHNRV